MLGYINYYSKSVDSCTFFLLQYSFVSSVQMTRDASLFLLSLVFFSLDNAGIKKGK